MLRKLLVASAVAALFRLFCLYPSRSRPEVAARFSEKAIGLRQSETSGRALKQFAPESQSLGQEERLQEGLGQQDIDELQEEGRAVSLHRRCQGVRQLIHQSGLAKAGDAIVT